MKLKGKKIACFLALPHHTRFFIPLSQKIKKEGGEILFIVTLSDYPYELDLIRRNLSFKYFIDYKTDDVRKKVRGATRELLDNWAKICYKWDGFGRWPLFKQSWFFEAVVEEYFCMEKFIEVERPDMFIAHHECNRWGQIIGHLTQKKSIPFVTFQEGDYYNDYIGFTIHTQYSNADLLWGDKTRDILKRYKCSLDKMFLIGNTHIDSAIDTYNSPEMIKSIKKEINIPAGKKVILFLVDIKYGGIKDKKVWQQFLQGLDRLDKEAVLIFKWHPSVFQNAYEEIREIFRELYPSAILLYIYDPYKLLTISDYCVTLGKTTLAIEALAFGKPLFALPTSDTLEDYYVKTGIAQSAFPPGNWSNLCNTMENGIPSDIQVNVNRYLKEYFYRLDGKSVERAIEAMGFILDVRKGDQKRRGRRDNNATAGRLSIIIPSGHDPEALLATLTSLSQNVKHPGWEVIIAVNDGDIKSLLSGISGDIRIVETKSEDLSCLYNIGQEASSGEYLIFMKPGILYFKGEGLLDAIKDGVAGMPIRNPDMTPYCLGIGFDFNFTPYMIKKEDGDPVPGTERLAGGGFIGIQRSVFEMVDRFDEDIADHLIEADICLSAREKGYPVRYLPGCLGFVFKETFNHVLSAGIQDSDKEWKQRIKFFAKWCGKLPKDDDFLTFGRDLLRV